MNNPKIGDKVSYEDMANPKRCGEIVTYEPAWDGQYEVAWDDGETSWSDCRQCGWKLVRP